MKKVIPFAAVCLWLLSCNSDSAADKTGRNGMDTATTNSIAGISIANRDFREIGRTHLGAFARADIDGWLDVFADNAVFIWNNKDSLTGKDAIAAYWRNRWSKLDSISFSNQTWLPIELEGAEIMQQQGTWVLGWYQFDASYKGNIKVTQWAHDAIHLNANDKVDRLIHFVDMGPIMRAFEGQTR